MIEVPAVINKAQLSQGAAHYGHVNAGDVELDGKKFAPGMLKYVGFAGEGKLPNGQRAMIKAGPLQLHGVHKFQELPGVDEAAETFDFAVLFPVQEVQATKQTHQYDFAPASVE